MGRGHSDGTFPINLITSLTSHGGPIASHICWLRFCLTGPAKRGNRHTQNVSGHMPDGSRENQLKGTAEAGASGMQGGLDITWTSYAPSFPLSLSSIFLNLSFCMRKMVFLVSQQARWACCGQWARGTNQQQARPACAIASGRGQMSVSGHVQVTAEWRQGLDGRMHERGFGRPQGIGGNYSSHIPPAIMEMRIRTSCTPPEKFFGQNFEHVRLALSFGWLPRRLSSF